MSAEAPAAPDARKVLFREFAVRLQGAVQNVFTLFLILVLLLLATGAWGWETDEHAAA